MNTLRRAKYEVTQLVILSQLDQLSSFLQTSPDTDNITVTAVARLNGSTSFRNFSTSIDLTPIRLRLLAKRTFANRNFLHLIPNTLSTTDVTTVGQVSQQLRSNAMEHMSARIDTALAPWIERQWDFRHMLSLTHSLVIGSLPLHILLFPNVRWEPDRLTIATPNGLPFSELINYLEETEHYDQDVDASNERTNHSSPVTRLVTLRRHQNTSGAQCVSSIIVLESENDHPERAVVHLQSTCLMCYMTHDRLFSLYPKLTLGRIAIIHPVLSEHVERDSIFSRWIRRYKKRGYQVYSNMDEAPEPCDDACPILWRNTMDVAVLRIHYERDWPASDTDDYSWCLNTDTDMPAVSCRNMFCKRNQLMLPRRDGRPIDAPFYGGNVRATAATFSHHLFAIEETPESI